MIRTRKQKFIFERKYSLKDHTPIVVQAEGTDYESLLENATYNVDCPDPSKFIAIAELPESLYDRVSADIAGEIVDAHLARAER